MFKSYLVIKRVKNIKHIFKIQKNLHSEPPTTVLPSSKPVFNEDCIGN